MHLTTDGEESLLQRSLSWRRYVSPKRLYLQELHGVVTSHKTAFLIVTAVKTLTLTLWSCIGGSSSPSTKQRPTGCSSTTEVTLREAVLPSVVRHILAANQGDSESRPEDGGDMFLRNIGSYRTTWCRHIPKESNLHCYRRENIKSYRLELIHFRAIK
jgi:hypothetical protein